MKNCFLKYGFGILGFCLTACSESEIDLSSIPTIDTEYTLPQGKSDADDRIVNTYEKYGTYILYEFTEADMKWMQSDVHNDWRDYRYTPAQTEYVGIIMDCLEDYVFRFYPEPFLARALPYKIFLTATLSQDGLFADMRILSSQMVISNCSEVINTLLETEAGRIAFKNKIQSTFWASWIGMFSIPKEFYEVSGYLTVASANPSDWNYARTLGFVANADGTEWSTKDPWPNSTLNNQSDLQAYLVGMRNRTSEDWAEDLTYPLVKEKYDILRTYFQDQFGFDIQAIGDANRTE